MRPVTSLIQSADVVPDNKVYGANIGPIWGRQDPDGSHVGPMNFAIWGPSRITGYRNGHRNLWDEPYASFWWPMVWFRYQHESCGYIWFVFLCLIGRVCDFYLDVSLMREGWPMVAVIPKIILSMDFRFKRRIEQVTTDLLYIKFTSM